MTAIYEVCVYVCLSVSLCVCVYMCLCVLFPSALSEKSFSVPAGPRWSLFSATKSRPTCLASPGYGCQNTQSQEWNKSVGSMASGVEGAPQRCGFG